ncbi:peptidoglycan amidohydrolase family protein [Limosilactobacillus secaliphilus]|nr:peptidoglycan amidohydrolase family protein [Limosilactobacillus secaliphilus]
MNVKRHYKLYKSGKLWCVAAISTLLLTGALATTAHADSQTGVDQSVAQTSQTTPTNQVPVDHQTQGNHVNVNQGHLDGYSVTMGQNNEAQLHVSGWQATGNSNMQRNRYVLVYDNSRHTELTRSQSPVVQRPDVQQAYPHVANSLNAGFNLSLNIPANALSDSLSVVARYSDDSENGEGQHTDYWFGPLYLDQTNRANLDSLTSEDGQLTVSGWHASNAAADKKYHYIIAFDQTMGHEIARQLVADGQARPDVAQAFPTIANAGQAGFQVQFKLTPAYAKDNIQFISRWTNDPAGNGSAVVDYWFSPIQKVNRGNLDSWNVSDGHVTVSGWHANDASVYEPYHFLILFDQTANRQLASALVPTEDSADVAKVFGADTKTAGHSRFNYDFDQANLIAGHQYALVSRYSAIQSGNGDDGHGDFTDYWYPSFAIDPQQQAYWLDSLKAENGHLNISGWFFNNARNGRPYVYAILLADGREVSRQALTLTARPDVGKVYPHGLGSSESGFQAQLPLSNAAANDYQLVLRFTDDPAGNGNAADIWTDKYSTNAGSFDSVQEVNGQLQITGWHALNGASSRPYQYIIALDATNGHELGRWQVKSQNLSRPDVAQAYPWIDDSGQSGFQVSIPQTHFNSQLVEFIHRYTDDPAGNGNYKDAYSRWCYFDPQSHALVRNRFLSLPSQDRSVYFGDNGLMSVGDVNINGQTYHFDRSTGKFYSFSQRVIDWFRSREGRLTYSQWGSRNGSDGTAHCSGAITQAIRDAGGYDYGHIYHDNYDTKHQDFYNYIVNNGYHQVYQGGGQYTPQYGDIVVWDPYGSEGHAMVISSFGNNPNVISVCGYTNEQPGTAVQEFNYNWYWNYAGRPNQVVFRPNNLGRA